MSRIVSILSTLSKERERRTAEALRCGRKRHHSKLALITFNLTSVGGCIEEACLRRAIDLDNDLWRPAIDDEDLLTLVGLLFAPMIRWRSRHPVKANWNRRHTRNGIEQLTLDPWHTEPVMVFSATRKLRHLPSPPLAPLVQQTPSGNCV